MSKSGSSSDSGFQILIIITSIVVSSALLFVVYVFYVRDILMKWIEARRGILPENYQNILTNYKNRDRSRTVQINLFPHQGLSAGLGLNNTPPSPPMIIRKSDNNSNSNSSSISHISSGIRKQFSKNYVDYAASANSQYEIVNNPVLFGSPSDCDSPSDHDIESGNIAPWSSSGSSSGSPSKIGTLDDDEIGNQVSVDTSPSDYREVLKSGYLMKKSSGYSTSWLMRWFFIVDGRLYYCRHHDDQNFGLVKATLVANLMISKVKDVGKLGFEVTSPGDRGCGIGGGVYEMQSAGNGAEGERERERDIEDWIQVNGRTYMHL